MTWEQLAIRLARAAGRAQAEGDLVATLVLAIKAAECAKIARLLSEAALEVPGD